MKWEQLVAARERKHFSQSEAAELIRVGLVTYQRWETGKTKPQPQHMRRLYDVFGTLLTPVPDAFSQETPSGESVSDTLPVASGLEDPSEDTLISVPAEEIDEPQAFIAAHLTTHLWSLAFLHHLSGADKRSSLRQAIKEFDLMHITDKNYQITRREALCSLATLPMITLGLTLPGSTVQPALYGTTLAHCTASIEACWELSKSGEARDLLLAFQCASRYLPVLTTMVKDSSSHRKEAARLAAQAYSLKHVLGLHIESPDVAMAKGHAKLAVRYAAQSDDPLLHLTALRYLTWGYDHLKNYPQALKTIEQARTIVEQADPPLPPVVTSAIYSTLAVMQTKNGVSPDTALGLAHDTFPASSIDGFDFASVDFGYAKLIRNKALAYYNEEKHQEALSAFAKVIDPDTLSPKVPMAGRTRVELLNRQTMTALKSPIRDRERIINSWKAGIQGAIDLQSQQRFDEACMAYEVMTGIWSGEQCIKDLRDLIVHW